MSSEQERAAQAPAGAPVPQRPGLRERFGRVVPPRGSAGADDERLAERIAHQWAALRAERERRSETPQITTGPSNFSRAQVPWGVDLAAAWAWRFLVIGVAGYVIVRVLWFFSLITIPLIIALLFSALATPVVHGMSRIGLPRPLSAVLVVVGGIATVAFLLTMAGQQVASGISDLAAQVARGLGEIRTWLKDGPLNASDSQIDGYLNELQASIADWGRQGEALTQVTEFGVALGHLLAGFFIVLFATYFFLADGGRIWAWGVRLAPRAAREHVDASGRVAWISLTQFVRATVIVAAVDAIGIMIVAAILQVPFVFAIGVLVFLGAFVPMIGATIAGAVAVLVALVDQGPVTALLMLGGVILVQQVEGHVLQPFLMGRFVSVHPLGVIVAIGCGVLLGGIAGALIAVPVVAVANAVVQHLASNTEIGDDEPENGLADDIEDVDPDVPAVQEEEEGSPRD